MKQELTTPFTRRQTMLAEDYELFFYSDQTLQKVQVHDHDCYELTFVLGGHIFLSIEGKEYECRQGSIFFIPPSLRHENRIDDSQRYERFVIWVSEAYAKRLAGQSEDFRWLFEAAARPQAYVKNTDMARFSLFSSLILSMAEEQAARGFGWKSIMELSLQKLLLLWGRDFFHLEPAAPSRPGLAARVMAYIDSHFEEKLSLDLLAGQFYVSKYHMSHQFAKTMGISIHQYILKKRLMAVCARILAGMELKEAVSACGFEEYSGFYRAFKKEMGCSPAAWRAKQMQALESLKKTHPQDAQEQDL